ncbi:MAG: DUF362 domain-containing protein [Eggerthellaceae bacterium]|nr:DUF362 domain-containing protein [Eggerthellaceae bacterium]
MRRGSPSPGTAPSGQNGADTAPGTTPSGASSASPADPAPAPAPVPDSAPAPQPGTDGASAPSQVYFVRAVNADALKTVFDALGKSISGTRIGVKLSSGEPGGHHFLQPSLISGLVSAVNGTIVECNTAYGGRRGTAESHYKVAKDHGFTDIASFQVMDEDGSYSLPVTGGLRLTENLVGAHFPEYDGFLVLSHFKGHAMAGFGGALKNISIGMASREGKCLIHTGGKSHTSWTGGVQSEFQEAMADASKAVLDAVGGNMLFVNVMNNLSVDCDCDSSPAAPKMADIGVLASTDPVALDQACVDLIYASEDNSADLIRRVGSRDGEYELDAAERVGVGSRTYELIELA